MSSIDKLIEDSKYPPAISALMAHARHSDAKEESMPAAIAALASLSPIIYFEDDTIQVKIDPLFAEDMRLVTSPAPKGGIVLAMGLAMAGAVVSRIAELQVNAASGESMKSGHEAVSFLSSTNQSSIGKKLPADTLPLLLMLLTAPTEDHQRAVFVGMVIGACVKLEDKE